MTPDHRAPAIGRRFAASIAHFFRRPPDTKASATAPLIALQTMHQPVWTPRDYEAFAREGFMQNAIVYRSVRMIAEAAASVPLLLYAGDEEIADHPLLDLLRRPNAAQVGPELFEAWFGHLLVAGNAYLEAVAIDGEVRELYALRPDRMKVVIGNDGWPEAWDYTVSGRTVRLAGDVVPDVRPVLHTRLFHADNDHYGQSPLEAASAAIDFHNAAARWNKALLDNSARPSGALVYTARDGNLSAEQFERLKGELEQGFQGAANAGRPLLLEGGLDWKAMSLSPRDMDFIEARHAAAREIALALGVPPMLLAIPGDNTYSNLAEAQRIFWRSTVLPLVNRFAKALGAWLSPAFDPCVDTGSGPAKACKPLELRPDLDAIEALAPEREALWTRIEATSFLTLNEKRAATGYGPLAGGDEIKRQPAGPDAQKFNPAQLRIPAGHGRESGRWTNGDGNGGSGDAPLSLDPFLGDFGGDGSFDSPSFDLSLGDLPSDAFNEAVLKPDVPEPSSGESSGNTTPTAPDGTPIDPAAFKPDRPQPPENSDIVQEAQASRRPVRTFREQGSLEQQSNLDRAITNAVSATADMRRIDENWRPPASAYETIEGEIAHYTNITSAARQALSDAYSGRIGHNGAPSFPAPSASLYPYNSNNSSDRKLILDAVRSVFDYPYPYGTIAGSRIDGVDYWGMNSWAPGFTQQDRDMATEMRDRLIKSDPDLMQIVNRGWIPNNAMFHAEANLLMRAARDMGGNLAGKTIDVQVDREMCGSCKIILPALARELGNPTVRFTDVNGVTRTLLDGVWAIGGQ